MPARQRGDAGGAVVEFTLVTVLLVVLALGIAQVALAAHVRSTLAACAAEGARVGANADRTVADAATHTRMLIADSLSPNMGAEVSAGYVLHGGLPMIQVDVSSTLPLAGLAGPSRSMHVTGHAVAEEIR